ncbi:MAG: hypothetical protein ACJ72A_10220 [Nocardioidaceae bacterium]
MCLRRYGLGRARSYGLWHRGQGYASKAHPRGRVPARHGRLATSDEFWGGEQGAAKVLINMDFDVVAEEEPFTIRCGGQAATKTDREEGRASFRGVSGVLHGAAGDRGMRRLRLIRLVLAWHRA